MHIFNTLTKVIQKLDLPSNQQIRIYSCGPTVYEYAHIGNLRSFIMADVLVRTLKVQGYKVDWVMNLTDIDDKTIKGTISEFGNSAEIEQLKTYTQRYAMQFFEDLQGVGIDTDQIRFIKVTDVIPQIQEFIENLIEQGFAYKAEDGSTYFSIEKYQDQFGDYGQLVGQKFLEGKKIGARIKNDEYDKENLSDFALWKAWDEADAQIYWEHPILGKGRPGWHIECSAINQLAFGGATTDIHTGGIDLIFPHHTNEIAQSQPLYQPFVNSWVHFEHLLVDGKKMAKSLKNDYRLADLAAKNFSGLDLRYLYLQSSYRQQTNFTWDALEAAKAGRLKLQSAFSVSSKTDGDAVAEVMDTPFLAALNDNLNTAEALALAHQH
ncbi:MAG TPA: cysteine--tRNA ligase, partial [Candidatus Doudnabacteria bacterium]|nr:cysteine--tRNA ligase [Candidatus Doudnabacteria bacterium]